MLSGAARIAHTGEAKGGNSMTTSHMHPKDCPDRKAAAADRAKHAAAAKAREVRQKVRAHTAWFGTALRG
jgi:hypothetical protein